MPKRKKDKEKKVLTREEMLQVSLETLDSFKSHVVRAKVQRFDELYLLLEQLTTRKLAKATEYLLKVKKTVYLEIERIWNLPNATPQMWENLFSWFDKPTLDEHKMLVSQYNKLRFRLNYLIEQSEKHIAAEAAQKATETGGQTEGTVDSVADSERVVL